MIKINQKLEMLKSQDELIKEEKIINQKEHFKQWCRDKSKIKERDSKKKEDHDHQILQKMKVANDFKSWIAKRETTKKSPKIQERNTSSKLNLYVR